MSKECITYLEKKYYFEIQEKNIKNINLKVNVSGDIKVSVPLETSQEVVKTFMKNKMAWIKKQLDYFETLEEVKENVNFEDGETIYLLGKQYKMKLVESENNDVFISNNYLRICTKCKYLDNKKYLQKLYESWLKKYAQNIFENITQEYYKPLKKYKINLPEIQIKKMKARWGSCLLNQNKIIYNLDLIRAPLCCSEYVALHELTHLKYSKHDENFYNFLTMHMPDWQERKKMLDEEYGVIDE